MFLLKLKLKTKNMARTMNAHIRLGDILKMLNALNLSLQGSNMHHLKSIEKLSAFIKKTMENKNKR